MATHLLHTNISRGIRDLSPDYFAFVMATGIVSLGARLYDLQATSNVLFTINVAGYIILLLMVTGRLIWYFPQFVKDFSNDARSPGFLTLVAATNILGYQFLYFKANMYVALVLLIAGFILWLVLIYALLTAIIIQWNKPAFYRGINGGWLLMVVATESIAILLTALAGHLFLSADVALFVALSLFLLGCLLYVIIITLIFYRLTFFRLRAADLVPAYWINMGAVAIITLAGSDLMGSVNKWPFLLSIDHFINGFTLLFWSFGTWWIPLIAILNIWRYLVKKTPIRYQPQYWGMVFPLGMYTVCTFRFAKISDINFLLSIPRFFIFIALGAWVITFIGLLHRVVFGLFTSKDD